MKKKIIYLFVAAGFLLSQEVVAQEPETKLATESGWFSLGVRNTVSAFSDDGAGIGTGGQFRIQFSNRVNTDWFADFITVNEDNNIRSEFYHIGWSVLYYPFANLTYPELIQPYVLAGHCFDYNKKTVINNPSVSGYRWGSAVQAGLGTHFNITEKFDVSLTCQYMIHLTQELETQSTDSGIKIVESNEQVLQGHLLTTGSLNYKIFRLWKK